MALAGTTQRQCPHISCFSPHTTPTRHPTSGAAAGLLHQVSLPFPAPPHLRQEADALTVPWAPGHPRKSPLETPRPPRSTGRTVLPEKLPGQGKLRTSPRPPSPPEGRSHRASLPAASSTEAQGPAPAYITQTVCGFADLISL